MTTTKFEIKAINQFSNNHNDSKRVFNAVVSFGQIVKSLKFTYRTSNDSTNLNNNEEQYYQRLTSDDRVFNIVKYLIDQSNTENLITFPLNFILNIPTVEDEFEIDSLKKYETFLMQEDIDISLKNAFIISKTEKHEKNELIIPQENEIVLIVDGQHRLAALKFLYYALKNLLSNETHGIQEHDKKIIEKIKKYCSDKYEEDELEELFESIQNFELSCTILVNFDIWEQGKVFADVNFNQKPVNKSLYYDIYGSYPDENNKNDIFVLHNWCKSLNNDEDSILKGKIKMLGTGEGYISQSFFCDALLPLVRKNGIWETIINDYINSREDKTDKLLVFLKGYFEGFYNKYYHTTPKLWPDQDDKPSKFDSILLKTTGLGALIQLIPHFYELIGLLHTKEEVAKQVTNYLNLHLTTTALINDANAENKVNGKFYFSKTEGEFSKGAGKGLQSKLYKELFKDLKFKVKKESNRFTL